MAMLDLLSRWRGGPIARGEAARFAAWAMVALGVLGPAGEASAADEATDEKTNAAGETEAPAKGAGAKAPLEEVPPAAPPPDEPEWEKREATRRSGFTAGITVAGGLGLVSGYPLDLKKIGRERYYTQSDISAAAAGSAWIGFSLTDWLSVGLGVNGNVLGASGLYGGGGSAFFHAEAFPMWSFGGVFREVGAMFDAGAATAIYSDTEGEQADRINAGIASFIGGGAFYEGLRVWHVGMGPCLYANYMWSDTLRYGNVTVGWRMAIYSGSVANKAKTTTTKTTARR